MYAALVYFLSGAAGIGFLLTLGDRLVFVKMIAHDMPDLVLQTLLPASGAEGGVNVNLKGAVRIGDHYALDRGGQVDKMREVVRSPHFICPPFSAGPR